MSSNKQSQANTRDNDLRGWPFPWMPLITLFMSCYNVGTIWMTHLSWRLWRYVGRAEFESYHHAWWFGIWGIQPVIFPPAILATLGSIAQLRWCPPRVPALAVRLGVALQVATWLLTATLWARWQGQLKQVRLEDGTLHPLYRRIMSTHWLRVALVTASGILQLWMSVRGFLPPDRNAMTSSEQRSTPSTQQSAKHPQERRTQE
jgi:hypothetical protein